jgi:DNA gyrase subunit B
MKSTVFRDGKIYEQEYERGKAMYPVKQIGETEKRGTRQTFYPDDKIFTQTLEFSYDTLSARMRELSFLNKGITITLDRRGSRRRW